MDGFYYPHVIKRGEKMTAARLSTFKDLLVWQKAMELSVEVYRLTKNYPSDERYGLTAETRKTSRSIPYNLAEGHKARKYGRVHPLPRDCGRLYRRVGNPTPAFQSSRLS